MIQRVRSDALSALLVFRVHTSQQIRGLAHRQVKRVSRPLFRSSGQSIFSVAVQPRYLFLLITYETSL